MVYKIADNILSPLGKNAEENLQAVIQGRTSLRLYDNYWEIPERFVASLFSESQNRSMQISGMTRFESLVVNSVRAALKSAVIDISSPRVIFILSTTKGNIELLNVTDTTADEYPGVTAENIAQVLGFTTTPITVCNACISGLSAITIASRLLETGLYDYAVVCGADCQSKFVISGFQSLKALSDEECHPFDMERLGLNLGEAAATMILCNENMPEARHGRWGIKNCAIRNDAFHTSAPSRTAEGCYRSLRYILQDEDLDEISFVNAHGTATMFNDQMESKAIERAGLSNIPANGLKGYYGHTMGAAGILETLVSMYAADSNIILRTRGFKELGVSGKINISGHIRKSTCQTFIKMLSGFGGCNAAIIATKAQHGNDSMPTVVQTKRTHHVTITPDRVVVNGKEIPQKENGKEMIKALYRNEVGDYPKFHKMDMLGKLGFVASELLLKAEQDRIPRFAEREDRAVILFNRASSLSADQQYLRSIADMDNYFPSPSVFVYTLPNIVTGEIAIRNKFHGETSMYILPRYDTKQIQEVLETSFLDRTTKSILGGWVDYEDERHFTADLFIIEKENK